MNAKGNTVAVESKLLPEAWQTTCTMEEPLAVISDLANALAIISETMGEGTIATTVQRLAWMVKEQSDKAEEMRGQLFHMTHPDNRPRLKTDDGKP